MDSLRTPRRVRFVANNGRRRSIDDKACSAKQSLPEIRGRKFETDDGLLARFKLTASALLDAPFSDGGRAGTKPNGFE
jgi:hypothetical protein